MLFRLRNNIIFNTLFKPQVFSGPLLIALFAFGLYYLPEFSEAYLAYSLPLVEQQQWWRMLTGQLLHTNFNHLLLNCGGLLLIWLLHGEYYSIKRFIGLCITFAILIGLNIYWFTDYHHYAGLSAILHSYLTYGALVDIIKKEKTGWLLLAGLISKVTYENIVGASADTETLINAQVATEAHFIGVIVGAFVFLVFKLKKVPL